MFEAIVPLRPFFQLGKVCTDNVIFRLHYRLTVIILLVCVIILTSKQFLGDPIQCMNNGDGGNDKAVNSFCWVYGTYTLTTKVGDRPGYNVGYAGIRPENGTQDVQIKHKYYQWVVFVLIGQAVLFCLPRYLWKVWEEGRLKTLTAKLEGPVMPTEWSETRRKQLIMYFKQTSNYVHNEYAIKYTFCELLNFGNVVGQIFLIDLFLDGAFRDYGEALATFTRIEPSPINFYQATVGPLDEFFPKLTKCRMDMYGPSGSLMHKDRLCVLPLNLVNEKIFAILWFWYLILAAASGLAVVFRIAVTFSPQLRSLILLSKLKFHSNKHAVSDIVHRYGFGGWFIILRLGKNLNPLIFGELIDELCDEEPKKHYKSNLYGNLDDINKDLQKV